jgi:hypothetical protein
MIAFATGLLHWIFPVLTAATATALILLARALPSHPEGHQANLSSHTELPEITAPEEKRVSGFSVVNDGRDL